MLAVKVQFECCEQPYPLIFMDLFIRRKPTYYIVTLIVPVVAITIVAVIGFFTPATTGPERTEKMNLGLATLLAMSILLLMVADKIPTTSDYVPLISKH